ncbi:MAG: dihydrofolate reductase [Candidatus Methylacidiphilales bacterium]|nr:dihydrofolate reductase [Candidatus Methylacidiphilales bacterium]
MWNPGDDDDEPIIHRPFHAILAMDEDRVIGKDGYLPWKVKEDLRWFRKTTTGNTIVMGSTTWRGILAKHGPAFPGRHVVVLTRGKGDPSWGEADVVHSIDELLESTRRGAFPGQVIIAGGVQVFTEAMPHIEKMYLTQIVGHHPGDIWMPAFESEFPCVETLEEHPTCTMKLLSRAPATP